MKKALLVLALLGAAAALAERYDGHVTNGRWTAAGNADGGWWFEMCGEAVLSDGGTRPAMFPCESCPDGWKNWNACEDRWRAKNDMKPRK